MENIYRVVLYGGALFGSAADNGTADASNNPQGQHLHGLALLTPGATTVLPGFDVDTATPAFGPKPYDFFFASPTVVYVADAGTVTGGLQKYIYHPAIGQWGVPVAGQPFNSPDVTFDNLLLTGLAGTYNAQGQTVIYAIANGTSTKGAPTTIVALTDTGDPNAKFTQIAAPLRDSDLSRRSGRSPHDEGPRCAGRRDRHHRRFAVCPARRYHSQIPPCGFDCDVLLTDGIAHGGRDG